MRRTICFALFALLVSSGAAFSQTVRSRGRVVVVLWAPRPATFFRNGTFCPLPYPVPYPVPYAVPYPIGNFLSPPPVNVFAGTISESHPQLVFQDGITYTVTDYWRIDEQLHFITAEDGGTKFVPHIVPFGDLDLQRTADANKARGFRFLVRDEPIDQWLEHHAQHH
jgi:hypothetical protein